MEHFHVVNCAQMRSLERDAFANNHSSLHMMEEAAQAVVQIVQHYQGRIAIVCGRGNNGGDGLAAARMLLSAGRQVDVLLLTAPESYQGDAAIQYAQLANGHHSIISLEDFAQQTYGCIVDGIWGIGLDKRPMPDLAKTAIQTILAHKQKGSSIVAIDIPSGVLGDTGEILCPYVCAHETVTFGYKKPGHLLLPGRACCGKVHVAPLTGVGTPNKPIFLQTNARAVDAVFPQRPMDSHKGTYGHVCILAGSRGMMGAGALAATAALSTGSGLVSWGYPNSEQPHVPWTIMTKPMPSTKGMLDLSALEEVLAFIHRSNVLAVGPGLGQSETVTAFIHGLLKQTHLPIVLDADGLNALQGHTEWLRKHTPGVITPHPGEMAKLLGEPLADIMSNPVKAANVAVERTGWTVLLKGATTIIASPGQITALNTSGNPGMATAGSGDTLTGIIASLVGQGLTCYNAAWAGAWIHGRAGTLAAQVRGMAALTALDILNALPQALPKRVWEDAE